MSVRLLLGAVVTVALVASALPAIDAAQATLADRNLSEAADRVRTAASELVRRSDPVPRGIPGARKRVRIDVPDGSRGGILRIGRVRSATGDGPRNGIVTQVRGNPETFYPLEVPVVVSPGGDPSRSSRTLSFREDGTLVLEYRLVDGRPVVVATRGFKSRNRTNPSHAGTPGAGT